MKPSTNPARKRSRPRNSRFPIEFFAFAVAAVADAQTCADRQDLSPLQPQKISADGNVVVGRMNGRAAAWIAGSITDLGTLGGSSSIAFDASADGSVIVGQSETGTATRAFIWTTLHGMVDLGTLGGVNSSARAITRNGLVVVGEAQDALGRFRAFRWDALGGMQDLGTLGGSEASARDVAAGGSVVVGTAESSTGSQRAFRWDAGTGMQDLGVMIGGPQGGVVAEAASEDGTVIVGGQGSPEMASAAGPGIEGRAFRWTAATGLLNLGAFGSSSKSWAFDVSADGRTIAGSSGGLTLFDLSRAMRWTITEGWHQVGSLPGDGPGCAGVSGDGTAFVGRDLGGAFRVQVSDLGLTYCRAAVPNSTGCAGLILAEGFPLVFFGSLELTADLLPQNAWGFFLASRTQGFATGINNSQGNICLAGNIGRFVGPGQIRNSGATGSFSLLVDLNVLPTPMGPVAVQPGETWNFQAWYRDANPSSTSNFTDAVSITFN